MTQAKGITCFIISAARRRMKSRLECPNFIKPSPLPMYVPECSAAASTMAHFPPTPVTVS